MTKYLPPLEICCDQAVLQIYVYSNQTLHFKCACKTHGIKGLKSPFAKSLIDYEIIVNGVKKTYPKEERREYAQNRLPVV